jgi:hypothetical protein
MKRSSLVAFVRFSLLPCGVSICKSEEARFLVSSTGVTGTGALETAPAAGVPETSLIA